MKRLLLVCALGSAFLAAQAAHADSFTLTFSGSTGSGHNQQTIDGTVNFDAPVNGGAITDAIGSVTFTSGETSPRPDNFQTGTFTIDGTSAFGPSTLVFADNTLNDYDGTYYLDGNGLGLNLVGSSNDINLHGTGADDGSIGFFFVFYNNVDTTWTVNETITDNSAISATPEPSSLALLGTSILGGAGILRRRFKA